MRTQTSPRNLNFLLTGFLLGRAACYVRATENVVCTKHIPDFALNTRNSASLASLAHQLFTTRVLPTVQCG